MRRFAALLALVGVLVVGIAEDGSAQVNVVWGVVWGDWNDGYRELDAWWSPRDIDWYHWYVLFEQNAHVRNGGTVVIGSWPVACCATLTVGGVDSDWDKVPVVGRQSTVQVSADGVGLGVDGMLAVGGAGGGVGFVDHLAREVYAEKVAIATKTDAAGIYRMPTASASTYSLSGGPLEYVAIGHFGAGCFRQAGGSVLVHDYGTGDFSVALAVGGNSGPALSAGLPQRLPYAGACGRYIQSGVNASVNTHQSGTDYRGVRIAAGAGSYGEYWLLDGAALKVPGTDAEQQEAAAYRGHGFGVVVGAADKLTCDGTAGVGFFFLGSKEPEAGIARIENPGYSSPLTIRAWEKGAGTFRGWGDVYLRRAFTNNGRVVADGYGTDRMLDMSHFEPCNITGVGRLPPVMNMIENASDNGWFAQNHGELQLPAASPVNDALVTCNWGESPLQGSAYDGTYKESVDGIDLVNSVQLTFDSVSAGAATIYLAAPLGATGSFGMLA